VVARLRGPKARRGTRHWVPAPAEVKAIDIGDLLDLSDWGDQLVADLAPLYDDVVDDAGTVVAEAMGATNYDTRNPGVRLMLQQRQNRVRGVNDTTFALLQATLAQGEEAGETIPELATRVEAVFDSAARNRSVMIARTEVVGASNAAGHLAGIANGATHKTWLAAHDARTRDAHVKANGKRRLLADDFTVDGEAMAYPGDQRASAANVVNCRCTLLFDRQGDDEVQVDEPTG
jgi:uncharacterized protein with gpF-like domain